MKLKTDTLDHLNFLVNMRFNNKQKEFGHMGHSMTTTGAPVLTDDISRQLDLFVYGDNGYSNLFPRFSIAPIYDRRKSNYDWASENTDAVHHFKMIDDGVTYEISVTGAPCRKRNPKTGKEENCIFWPGDREERVVDAIMKIASGGYVDFIETTSSSGYGSYFTVYMIRKMTGMHSKDVKEAIDVLNRSNLKIVRTDTGREELSASFFPIKHMSSDNSGKRNERCYVLFHPAIKVGIENFHYRPYLYEYSEKYRGSLSRHLHKRLVIRFTYARDKETYHFKLRTAINDYGGVRAEEKIKYSTLRNLARDLRRALKALADNDVIKPDFRSESIRDRSGEIVDYKYTVSASPRFAKHQIESNVISKSIRSGASDEGYTAREEKVINP